MALKRVTCTKCGNVGAVKDLKRRCPVCGGRVKPSNV